MHISNRQLNYPEISEDFSELLKKAIFHSLNFIIALQFQFVKPEQPPMLLFCNQSRYYFPLISHSHISSTT